MALKLDTAQTVALHTAESIGLSAGITLVSGIIQYVSLHGLNLPQLGIVAGGAFLGALAMVYKSLSTSPAVLAGVTDTIGQMATSVANIEQALIPGVTPRASSVSTKAAQVAPKPIVLGTPDVGDHAG